MNSCLLQVDVYKSTTKDAGNDVFALEPIQENMVYGPNVRVIVNPRNLVKTDKLRVGGYA